MHRSMMQIYVRGSDRAVELYQKAFDAELVASYPHSDGTFMHAELNVYGQILAVSEALKDEEKITGTTMQFCLHFGEGKEDLVLKAYNILKNGAKILYPLSTCDFSELMVDLIDIYGVRWCIFV
ncbi:MAG TPA: VOC family protein [Lachnoclostridium phytofermentans]|uniref:VOC family protein n=1 Tax=Lachnoclostridium phytofermentans TaxID=66219 RepID=A0A3D2X2Z0_9FIRM|nr:VOC family protein [Lachnoclostridium sp.]HCL01501.1 VOC family protein [Lachnoclostridium phytofermentans]